MSSVMDCMVVATDGWGSCMYVCMYVYMYVKNEIKFYGLA